MKLGVVDAGGGLRSVCAAGSANIAPYAAGRRNARKILEFIPGNEKNLTICRQPEHR